MTILGIDASSKSTGWALFNNGKLINYGCIIAIQESPYPRLRKIESEIKKLLNENIIDLIVLEEVRPEVGSNATNLHTHKILMYLQGLIELAAYENQNARPQVEYLYPSEWRKECGIVTGKGIKREALKKKDIEFVQNTFNLKVNYDIADAIGIGYGYIKMHKKTKVLNWE